MEDENKIWVWIKANKKLVTYSLIAVTVVVVTLILR